MNTVLYQATAPSVNRQLCKQVQRYLAFESKEKQMRVGEAFPGRNMLVVT
jgi:hypothetical protein